MANHLADILFLLSTAHHAEAESWLNEAILSHEKLRMNWDLAHDHRLVAQLLESTSRAAGVRDYFNRALVLFNECGAEGWCRTMGTG
jgi:hypothetical protein